MKFDFKNILIGIIIGVLGTLIVGCLLNDVYIDVRVGDIEEITNSIQLWEQGVAGSNPDIST